MLVTLCANAYVHLVAVGLRLRRLNVGEHLADAKVSTAHHPSLTSAEEEHAIARAQRALRVAERFFPVRVACLQRSLVLQRLLRPLGVVTRLRIGVRKDPAELKAHAWLEYKDRAINTDAGHQGTFQILHPVQAKDERA
jgi:hypothetical protein